MDLYSLRHANRSVKLGALLYLLVLGYAYLFAFLMVKTWSGLTPARVETTYVPKPGSTTPIPNWKKSDWACDVLPEKDPARS